MADRPRSRSRQPLHHGDEDHDRWSSKRISKVVASFGRYPEKRPPLLRVDGTGAFRLRSLMDEWGFRNGLDEWQVLHGLRRHMFHDDGLTLRFGISCDDTGDVVIRVCPKREAPLRGGGGEGTAGAGAGARAGCGGGGGGYGYGGRGPAGASREPAPPRRRDAYEMDPRDEAALRREPPRLDAFSLATGYGGGMTREERRASRCDALAGRRGSVAAKPLAAAAPAPVVLASPRPLSPTTLKRRVRFGLMVECEPNGGAENAKPPLMRCKSPDVFFIGSDDDDDMGAGKEGAAVAAAPAVPGLNPAANNGGAPQGAAGEEDGDAPTPPMAEKLDAALDGGTC